ncbi:hypothetical protein ABBQ38_007377 [Trebouxia sp. C0009 RCD-2024]
MFGFGRRQAQPAASPAGRTPPASSSRGTAPPGAPGVPLELVRFDSDSGKFHVGEQALKMLRSTKDPVGVVAVCGRARQGKSFILNQLLGQSTGFQVAPSVRPCTKGLWMWSSPIARKNADGSQYQLVLLDSEGIDAWDQTGQYSTQIFSLAVLLSSLFVYNQMGGIDEAALDKLSLVTEMTKRIRVRSENSNEADLASFTPAFLWLLRDFYLSLEEEGQAVTARDYLETALRPVPGSSSSAQDKNQIRASIKALFPDRDCFPLVRPMSDEKMLAKLETLDSSTFRPEFQQGVKELTSLIFHKAQPKRMNNSIITGPMLAALTQAYVDALNHGAVPTIATAWQGVAEAESRRAADMAESAYQQAFNQNVPADEPALDREFDRALSIGQKAFREVAVGDTSIQLAHEKRFQDRVQQLFTQFKKQRLTSAELECEKLVNSARDKLTEASRQPGMTPEILQAEYAKFERSYTQSTAATGPAKWEKLIQFRNGAFAGLQQDVQQRANQAKQQELAAERQKAQDARQQAQQEQAQAASLRQEVTRLGHEVSRLQSELNQERSSKEQHASRVTALEQDLRQETSLLNAARQTLQQAVQDQKQKGETEQRAAVSQLGLELQQARQQLVAVRKEASDSKLEVDSLKRQLDSTSTDSNEWISKYRKAEHDRSVAVSDKEKTERELRGQLSQAEQQLSQANTKLEQAEQQAKAAQAALTQEKLDLQQRLQEAQAQARVVPPATTAATPEPMVVDGADTSAGKDPAKMTIAELKTWLDEHNFQEKVWELGQKKAKKPEYVECVRQLM